MDFDDLIFALGVLVAIASVVGVIFGFAYLIALSECGTYGTTTGLDTKMAGLTCYVNDGTRWSAWEEFKLRQMGADAQ